LRHAFLRRPNTDLSLYAARDHNLKRYVPIVTRGGATAHRRSRSAHAKF
jgi:hypothetical protein